MLVLGFLTIYIISVFGDTLDGLADKYYQDVTMWVVIAKANHIGHGSMNIEAGTRLRIPINPSLFMQNMNTSGFEPI